MSLSHFSYENCHFCPRECRVNRYKQQGFCKSPAQAKIARAALHHWEEPCISGSRGSGTVFFSGCTLRCCFCQNSQISQDNFGVTVTAEQLATIFLDLQAQGAHNINLVTATQYLPDVMEALELAKPQLRIPVVYNCGGYEKPSTILALKDYVDIWLPDLKYKSSTLSKAYSAASDYFEQASSAIQTMIEVAGAPIFAGCEGVPDEPEKYLMQSGVMLRHLVLPNAKEDSIALLRWIADTLPKDSYLISLMSQYTPYRKSEPYPELNRRITSYEYQQVLREAERLGLEHGFIQKKSSAKEEYTPPFNLEGCP
ncbi:MAG: 4Fe-4S cluster-binding domain-containing protein [bacterium]|nr:4Fe-4S cluster-binding domain-containing protein [bacterium]